MLFTYNSDYESKERFDLAKFIEFSEEYQDFDVLNSAFLQEVLKVSSIGEIKTTNKHKHQPDLLTYELFDNELYWWLILYYNNIDSIDVLVSGMILKIPSFEEIEQIIFTLRQRKIV